ncbi:hypothetical protein KIPB_017138, partial [Kipferlia bialata]
ESDPTHPLVPYTSSLLDVFRALPLGLLIGLITPLGGLGDTIGNKASMKKGLIGTWFASALPLALLAATQFGGVTATPYMSLGVMALTQLVSAVSVALLVPNAMGYLWRQTAP